jgi:hypothetical protein
MTMINVRSYGNTIEDWRRLLVAAKENAELLPDLAVETKALSDLLAGAQEAKSRQDLHASEKQRATQDLQSTLAQGKDLAIQIRGAVKFKLGPRNEKLVQFRVAPLRKRGPRKALAAKKPPVLPVVAAPEGTPQP